jgi:LPS sulfotransferase NodH
MPRSRNSAASSTVERNDARCQSKAPVFVVGCPRSGTTYLYYLLLSAGNFAIYRSESEIFHLLEPRFGDLSIPHNRKRMFDAWAKTYLFKATGLAKESLEDRIMRECRNGGDFLRIVMEEIAGQQGVERWAECTPDHILYLDRIHETLPDALMIHIVRDARDVAVSMEKQGWPKQLPWDSGTRRNAAGLYWEWMVQAGRKAGMHLGPNYLEVRYEDLMADPASILEEIGEFIGQNLDYEEIKRTGIGAVSKPNTSFQQEPGTNGFNPVGRWRKLLSKEELSRFEKLVGHTLREFGYPLEGEENRADFTAAFIRTQYRAFFRSKFFLRTKTPIGRMLITRDLSWI